jgi:hypothetical protein
MEKLKECWKARASLWVGLIVFLVGVIGQVLIWACVSEDFLYGPDATYGHFQLVNAFKAVAEALMFLGAIWAGVYLARWGIRKKKAEEGEKTA